MAEINNTQDLPFAEALYQSKCGRCKSGLEWEANFDADGTTYYATCCSRVYTMRTKTVTVTVGDNG